MQFASWKLTPRISGIANGNDSVYSHAMKIVRKLKETYPTLGVVTWIGLSPATREPLQAVDSAIAIVGKGFENDHHAKRRKTKRQVTIIQQEHLPVVAELTSREDVGPGLLRRNLSVSGINVWSLKDQKFRIGEVLLEGTGPCAPCSRMDETLGLGGYNAMRGHGGITARVLEGGSIRVNDTVEFVASGSVQSES
jgi:MOSC domain-containing protein YiiM